MRATKAASIALVSMAFLGLAIGRMFFAGIDPVAAQGTQPTPPSPHSDTGDCLACHSDPNMTGRFPSGETMSLYFDPEAHPKSKHMPRCRACHESEKTYPHENSQQSSCAVCHWEVMGSTQAGKKIFELSYPDRREIALQINQYCAKCHKEKFDETADSIHLKMLDQGNRFAPVCVDCHAPHDVVQGSLTNESVPIICSTCHLSVYTSYKSSIHGAGLGSEAGSDLPTCGDCHGIHNVHGPRDTNFRADSIDVCGGCHADPTRMEPYGLSTDVLNTYLFDFHGRSVDFARMTNIPQTTKATCYDCHGVHNIRSVKDEASTVNVENLQKTCQQCHPDATDNFPAAWLGHGSPDWHQSPVLAGVNSFYQVFVPAALGGSLLYILLDLIRRIRQRFQKR